MKITNIICLCLLIVFFVLVILFLIKCNESFSNEVHNSPSGDCELMLISPSTTTGPRMESPKDSKYILFQIDCGGLNNIRMQYEILTVIAWLSKRTLVLHPKTTWYLLGNTKLKPEDIFDFNCWASHIPILRWNEWLDRLKKNTDLGENTYRQFFINLESGDYGKVHEPIWSPGKTKFKAEFLENNEDIWYFYCDRLKHKVEVETFRNLDHRMLGNTECYFDYLPPNKMKELRRLIWNSLKFKEEYYIKTQKILNDLKLKSGEYNALHLRNWEGAQPQYRLRSQEEVIDNLMSLDKEKPILFLSQDVLKNLPERLREKVELFLKTYKLIRPNQNNKQFEQSIIEMLMCVPAYRFYGSPSSTYSTGIMMLRGNFSRFCKDIDDNPYFMDKKNYDICASKGWGFNIIKPERWREMYTNV